MAGLKVTFTCAQSSFPHTFTVRHSPVIYSVLPKVGRSRIMTELKETKGVMGERETREQVRRDDICIQVSSVGNRR